MTNAYRDENGVPTMIGALNTDGVSIVRITANPTNNALSVDDDTTGDDYRTTNASRDENGVPVLMAVSSTDGVTPVELYVDADGKILIDSN